MTADRLPEIFALIWRAHEPDETFDSSEFERRVPRVMQWLAELRRTGRLVACGGGGFAAHAGGLTLVRARDSEEALSIASDQPLNEIGTTEVFAWDVYWADLDVPRDWRRWEP